MFALFEGHMGAYGKFNYSGQIREDGKVKGSGITVREPYVVFLWEKHLDGKDQLGVIPINEDNMVKFGAIDVDSYDGNPHTRDVINNKIIQHKLPLIQFRSKSGGIHLYMFIKDYASAALVQRKLKEFAAFLGFGNSEIFPKQTQILKERGDLGQWINMPYYDYSKTDRYGISAKSGEHLDLPAFLLYVEDYKITSDALNKIKFDKEEPLPHGPPCLQLLCTQGFPEGTRNDGLFNIGIYAQKSNPDGWRSDLEAYNSKFMKPPLTSPEVQVIIKSLDKKEYNYTCKKQPICSFCNVSVCRTKKYGVGERMGLPSMGSLVKLNAEPPIWFIDIEGGGRLELITEELQNPILFQRKCMNTLNIMPPVLKRDTWGMIVSELLAGLVVVDVPKEMTHSGNFESLLEEFCIGRKGDETNDCILRGLVWNFDGHHHFRLSDFMSYLERKKFEEYNQSKVISILRDKGAGHKKISIQGRGINVYMIPLFKSANTDFVPPPQDGTIPF